MTPLATARSTSALDDTLALIARSFGKSAAIANFKAKVRRVIREPDHPRVAARYGARADMLRGRSLDAAIVLVERWRRDEAKAFAIARTLGRGNALSLQVTLELRLILRWMRRSGYAAVLDTVAAELARRAA